MSNNWDEFIHQELQQTYLQNTIKLIEQRRSQGINIFPCDDNIFTAFKLCPLEKTKVVILGQDPYHGENQAHGLSFSVLPDVKIPPSLVNMYKELQQDVDGFIIPTHGYLQSWAEQGVFLLNTVLTVEEGQAHSHKSLGWETFSDKVIETLSKETEGVIFLLWGAHAQKKGAKIDVTKHHILYAPHPSPLSVYRGFYGCKHFSKANELLQRQGKTPINWNSLSEVNR